MNSRSLVLIACAATAGAWGVLLSCSSKTGGAGGQSALLDGGPAGSGGASGQTGPAAAAGGPGGSAGSGSPVSLTDAGPLSTVNTATQIPPPLQLTRVAPAAKNSVLAIAQAVGDDRIFVAERPGLVEILRHGQYDATPFADFSASVIVLGDNASTERGFLNFVLHPDFAQNGRFFVYYTRKGTDPLSTGGEGDIVISEGHVSTTNANLAAPTLTPLVTVTHPYDYHIGGFLAFGPDGYLYAGTGDGGAPKNTNTTTWDWYHAGQSQAQRLSKILRIDVDHPTQKVVGNLDGAGADPRAWAYGVRNPFRGSFDRATGDLYFGDVGESSYEEVDFERPGKTGLNFGWGFDATKLAANGKDLIASGMEGLHPFPNFTNQPWTPFGELPILEYPHDGVGWSKNPMGYGDAGWSCSGAAGSTCSRAVIGGVVYRGAKIPALYGRYIYGDNPTNAIKSFVVASLNGQDTATWPADLTSALSSTDTPIQGLSGFGQDAAGEVYVLDLFGNIYRIDPK